MTGSRQSAEGVRGEKEAWAEHYLPGARIQWLGLAGGPLLAALAYLLLPVEYLDQSGQPAAFSPAGRLTLAIMIWMALWWITEAMEISVTALLPLAVFPVIGIRDIQETAAPYAHPMIFLFMGGFMIAIAMQRWGLDRRIALLTLRYAGTRPSNMVAGFMLTTAGLSAFVSNTATTAMMVPIAMSVVHVVRGSLTKGDQGGASNLALCLLLGIAYAASIGGIATIIGTPPNSLLVAFVRSEIAEPYQTTITFSRWLLVGIPMTLLFLPICWLLLTRLLFPLSPRPIEGGQELIEKQIRALGAMSRGEKTTAAVFTVTALCWILRPLMVKIGWSWGDTHVAPGGPLRFGDRNDRGLGPVRAAGAGVSADLHVGLGVDARVALGILILFGGGLSLASAVKANGVAEFIGGLSHHFAHMPPVVIVLVVTATVIFLTELTSNAATTATLLPVLAALRARHGSAPVHAGDSRHDCGQLRFMMPVATPPNAIIFGSGEVRIAQMARAGIWLNLVGIVLITVLAIVWFPRVFQLTP